MTILAALATTAAVLVGRPPHGWWLRHRLGGVAEVPVRRALAGVVGLVVVVAGPELLSLPGPQVVLGLTVAGAAAVAVRQLRSVRARAAVARRRAEVADLLGLMAAELRAGALPARVLVGLSRDFDVLGPAARAASSGGDVPAALRHSAAEPGRALLGDVAGAWLVAERAGAPLAKVLDPLEQSSRADREIDREVGAGVAPARATGRVMALLPLVGLALGSGMGGDPVAVLTGTWPGVLCLAAGVGLACCGVVWVDHIALSLERTS
jgi:tight adherence protein B